MELQKVGRSSKFRSKIEIERWKYGTLWHKLDNNEQLSMSRRADMIPEKGTA